MLAVLPGDVLSAGADERDRHLRHVQPDAATLQHDFSLQLATRLAPAAAALRVRRFGNAAGGNDDLTGIGLDSWDSGAGGGEGSEAGSPGAHAPPSPPKPGQLLAPPLVPAQWVGCAGCKGVVLHHTARITPFCCHVYVCVCARAPQAGLTDEQMRADRITLSLRGSSRPTVRGGSSGAARAARRRSRTRRRLEAALADDDHVPTVFERLSKGGATTGSSAIGGRRGNSGHRCGLRCGTNHVHGI